MAAGILMTLIGVAIIGWMTLGGRARQIADLVMPG